MAERQQHLSQALADFRKRQAELANSAAKAAPKKNAQPKREPRAKSAGGRGRGQTLPVKPSVSGKEVVKNSVAKSTVPLAKQIKNVLDYLSANRDAALAPDDISERFGHDGSPGTPLYSALAANEKLQLLPDGAFAYKASHELGNKEQLYDFLAQAPEGTRSTTLKDAYLNIGADITALQAEGLIWALPDQETGGLVLYPREKKPLIQTTPDVAALWHEVAVPVDPEALEEELRRAGIKPAPRSGFRRRPPPPPKERAKRAYRPRNVTNVHMPELFRDAAPTQID